MGHVRSPRCEEQDNCTFHEKNPELKRIVNELSSISDVCGAILLDRSGSVIAKHVEEHISAREYIEFIVQYSALHQKGGNDIDPMNGMFNQQVMDYNGHKLLIGWIAENAILLLLLNKKAYLGLTMLDMEGCLRDIDPLLFNINT